MKSCEFLQRFRCCSEVTVVAVILIGAEKDVAEDRFLRATEISHNLVDLVISI